MNDREQSRMKQNIRIVTATSEDAGRIAPLLDAYRQFYKKASDVRAAETFLRERLERKESTVLLALAHEPMTRTDAAAGFTQLYPSFTSVGLGTILTLNDLFVALEFRRFGVARMLIEGAAKIGRDRGCQRLVLLTEHTNTPAKTLYESMGWKRDELYARYTLTL
jgi:ribosomal protein S18 acetylase RimI-like enzyme